MYYDREAIGKISSAAKVGEEVLVSGNFEAGKFIKNSVDDLVEAGYVIGAEVTLKKRITASFPPHLL